MTLKKKDHGGRLYNKKFYCGRNLDEINIDPQENLAVDSDASDTEVEDHMSDLDAASSISVSSTQSSGSSDEEMSLVIEDSGESHTTKESSQTKRRKWTKEEIQAVEKTLMDYISSGKVPRKAQCLECIKTSPIALKGRSWEGVKFYVKNRIDALKRDSVKIR
ncbi:uncharacterized protein Hap1MRO34_003122 [Clarias gariepinus]